VKISVERTPNRKKAENGGLGLVNNGATLEESANWV